jgi:hypothetical protein
MPSTSTKQESSKVVHDTDRRQSSSLPTKTIQAVTVNGAGPLGANTSMPTKQRVDKFGFILNMDSHGNIQDDGNEEDKHLVSSKETRKTERRLVKWDQMFALDLVKPCTRPRLVLKRLRKGIPDSLRAKTWAIYGNVPMMIKTNPGHYEHMVKKTVSQSQQQIKSFQMLQETIERDIHRTFPRHSMFHDFDTDQEESKKGICGTSGISDMIHELDFGRDLNDRGRDLNAQKVINAKGGQASLRRVLKAYSLYDEEIGYCQGMNYITGMFLTIMSEEEAYWMLVYVMKEEPCMMRGMFGEGMSETHMVLYVAEKLIHQFLPRLARHLDRENIHITMVSLRQAIVFLFAVFSLYPNTC